MNKKTKGILKFLLILGAIAAAAVAVAAFVDKMQKKLCCKHDESDADEEGDRCNGECDECELCDCDDEADGEVENVEAAPDADEAVDEKED